MNENWNGREIAKAEEIRVVVGLVRGIGIEE